MLYIGFPFFNQSGEPKNKRRNCMRTMILVLAAALAAAPLAVSPAKASEKTDVIATLKQYVSSFNKGDKDAMDAACAPQASIIDEFPPHAWQGATASANWRNDYETFVKNHGITDVNIPFREPSHIEITGDRAYVVMPTINLQAAWEAGYRGRGGLDVCVTKGFRGLAHNGLGVGRGALSTETSYKPVSSQTWGRHQSGSSSINALRTTAGAAIARSNWFLRPRLTLSSLAAGAPRAKDSVAIVRTLPQRRQPKRATNLRPSL
jgi:hypothetical protein